MSLMNLRAEVPKLKDEPKSLIDEVHQAYA